MEIELNGIPCYYEQAGQGKDVLLLHGWGGSAQSWLPLYNHLQQRCRVTALDFPGHGRSGFPPNSGWSVDEYVDYTVQFIRTLELAGTDVIAHSFGGRVSILLATRQPQLVGKLLLTGAAGLIPTRPPRYYLRTYGYKALKALTYLLPWGGRLRARLAGRFGSADYRALPESMRRTFVKVVNQDLRPALPYIRAETLLVWGTEDTETPLWMGRVMEREIPGAALVTLQGAGHFAYLERFYEFSRVADSFLFGSV